VHIALVSAHYPPNFVSGGTLVPQRIAEGFAHRGHRVSVFAGSYQDGRADLTERDEVTAGGVHIRWITTTGMLTWSDETNFANDAVDARFAAWLRDVRPDVVHVHNLQGMGGSLVSTAAASGACVVVTMHDMWWWCARQFLVTADLRPCSSVVDCSACPCERDRSWLDDRNRRLAMHLRNADLVLAPSATMVGLLAANGVDPARLRLDENPAPDDVRLATHRSGFDGPVRFVFAGGRHPVKGGYLAADAARLLTDQDGWTLDLYGMGEQPTDVPEQVRLRPPYAADRAATVLAGYDVLLMSSVMLESYSLLTREALAAGCAVITGDNPGPTEVVTDGVNGLVVPRGDAQALAGAMRRLIEDRELLARLQPPPGALQLRTLDEQLDQLQAWYESVRRRSRFDGVAAAGPAEAPGERAESPALSEPVIRRVLIVAGIDGAPLRYRAHFVKEALAAVGVGADLHMYRDVQVPRKARAADAVVFYRVPATEQILDLIELIRDRPEPVPILFDIDDLIFDPSLRGELDPVLTKLPGMDLDLYWQGIRRYRTTLEACDAYIGSTPMLCGRVTELTGLPAYRWANGVGREIARLSDGQVQRPRKPGPIRIGYLSGTNTHNEDWAFVEPAVVRVMQERPDVELWIGGLLEYTAALEPYQGRIRRMPLMPWDELPAVLRDLDVNLAPLEPGKVFNEAKSAIKWLEAALTRTPTVASPSEPFRESIRDGVTGLLATSVDDWVAALLRLIDDVELRARIGHAARSQVLLSLSPAAQGYRYLDILRDAARRVRADGHRNLFQNWTPEVTSEAWILQAPDYYGPRSGGGLERSVRRLVREYRASAVRTLRSDGLGPTARKAVSVAGRVPRRLLAGRR
jgi:glycosyltransferase involved in cell wall biosynthesis